jgi:uncharacterized Zn finger protein
MDNRKKEFLENRRSSKKKPEKKTEYERRRTHEEVEQIKKDLINYAKTSWGKEWIYHNLQIGRPFRMQRGIDYANDEKRIDNISITKGQIFATVQGTAPTPYRVKINFDTIEDESWKKIIQKLSKQPLNLIKLLEGILPLEFIKSFEEIGQEIFPNALNGLDASCSCPDKAIPCKHIASVILYLSRVIDFNPFLLLELRGKPKNELLEDLSLKTFKEDNKRYNLTTDSKNLSSKISVPKISDLNYENMKKESNALNFNIKKPGRILEIIENIGNPYDVENKSFEIVLKRIYFKVSNSTYKMSL